jgi:hypothetical protein
VIGAVVWGILARRRAPQEVEIVIEQPAQPIEVVVNEE